MENIEKFLNKNLNYHSSGYVILTYQKGVTKSIVKGNRQVIPEVLECTKDTLYDIASLTKVYTAVLVYMAYEENKLDIKDDIKKIDARFKNLDGVTILDLLSHNLEIWTDGYLGDAKTKEEFFQILFSAYVKRKIPTYVDTHYIILGVILEKIYYKSLEELYQEKIFAKLNLTKTTVNPSLDNVASNNYEYKEGNQIDLVSPGLIHDPKGRVAKGLGITTGHAAIFTTGEELLEFLKTFLNNKLLKKETTDLMLQHDERNSYNTAIKEIKEEGEYLRTYNYMGVRYHNIIEELNDVPNLASANTVVFSGFTGPSFLIDFEREIIIVVMANVMHNTKLNREERKKITDKLIEMLYNNLLN